MTPSHASATLRPVFSGTYPCIPFGRQRIRHPGAKPGSWRLDGDGIADACQFATCWKEESSKMGTSVANTRFFYVLRLIQISITRRFVFFFFPSTWKSKRLCLKDVGVGVRLVPTSLPFSSAREVLIIRTCSHMLMPVVLRLCGRVRRKRTGGPKKGESLWGFCSCVLPVSCPGVN